MINNAADNGLENIKNPTVSVIMPNYRTPVRYLRAAVDSILTQTYSDFELIIVDDASGDDESVRYIESLKDHRVIFKKNSENRGPAYTRNRALDLARGKYILIMDSDDISMPQRMEKLVAFMESHPDVFVCGSGVRVFGDSVATYLICPRIKDAEIIRIYLLFGNKHIMFPIINNRMIKSFEIRYDESSLAEDYKLWFDCSNYGKLAVYPEVLYDRRMQPQSITSSRNDQQLESRWRVILEQLDRLEINLPEEDRPAYNCLYSPKRKYDLKTKALIKTMIANNDRLEIYNKRTFRRVLWGIWGQISCYGLKNEKEIKNKCVVLFNMPPLRYPLLIRHIFLAAAEMIKSKIHRYNVSIDDHPSKSKP